MNFNYDDLKIETLEINKSNDLNDNLFKDSLKRSKGQIEKEKIREDNDNDFVE